MAAARFGASAAPADPSDVDAETFRDAMATLAAPLTVLTCYDEDRLCGLTVNAVCSLSVTPPRVLLCLNRANRSHDAVVHAERLCLHVLGGGQEYLASRFSSPGDRFRNLSVHRGAAPELTDVPVRLTLVPDGVRDGGDHTILIARVVDVTAPDPGAGGGLVWHHRGAANAVPARDNVRHITEKIA